MRALPIVGEYPPDWQEISDRVWAEAGHRCIRCLHPYRKGEHGKGEWTPCDGRCRHAGPVGFERPGHFLAFELENGTAGEVVEMGKRLFAQWRIGTVHHFDGDKANCQWWNLLALCQRCHLTIQARVNPQQPYMFEHSDWLKPYVAGFYARKYQERQLTRAEVALELEQLLALERIA